MTNHPRRRPNQRSQPPARPSAPSGLINFSITLCADGLAMVHRDREAGLAYARDLSARDIELQFILSQALPWAVIPEGLAIQVGPGVYSEVKAGRTEALQLAVAEAMGNVPAGEDGRWLTTKASTGETAAYDLQRQAVAVAAYLVAAGEPVAAVWSATFAPGQAPVVDEPFCVLSGTQVWVTPENGELIRRLGFEVADETGKYVFLPAGDSISAAVEAPAGWKLFGLYVLQTVAVAS